MWALQFTGHFNGIQSRAALLLPAVALLIMTKTHCNAGDYLMDAKPRLLALTPVVRCVPVPMQVITW